MSSTSLRGRDIVMPDPANGFTNQFGSAYFSPDGRLVGYLREFLEDNDIPIRRRAVRRVRVGTPIGPRLREPTGDVNWTGRRTDRPSWSTTAPTGLSDCSRSMARRARVIGKGDLAFADIQRLAP